ncbi:hypothetical protein CT19431_40102 [Cupriavidus taiwanensis]|nr:hypothetical protein CT19431_40102 [Cupriavidus taiwanensis]
MSQILQQVAAEHKRPSGRRFASFAYIRAFPT